MSDNLRIEGLSRPIDPIGPDGGRGIGAGTGGVQHHPGPATGPGSFGEMLENALERTNEMQAQADDSIKELVAGRSKNIHETMLTIERADVSLKLMMQVRNKVLDAYREVMRMQV